MANDNNNEIAEETPMGGFKALRILLVDDDADFGDYASRIIKGFGCYVERCTSAHEAFSALVSDSRFNLLITDIYMKPVNGLELIQKVREEDRFLPILVLSGLGDIAMAVECIRAGALDYIAKTAQETVLHQKLSEFLQKWQNIHVINLSKQEKRLLHLVLEGFSNHVIAKETNRSIRTIEDQRHRIMEKLGAKNQIELVKIALNY